MTSSSPHPIYDEVAEEQRTRTGAFGRFALEGEETPAEEPAAAPAADAPTTAPLEAQPRRTGRPRSQR